MYAKEAPIPGQFCSQQVLVGRVGLEPTTFGLKVLSGGVFWTFDAGCQRSPIQLVRDSEWPSETASTTEKRPECWQNVGRPQLSCRVGQLGPVRP